MATVSDDFNRASGAIGANWTVDTGAAGTDTGAPPAVTGFGWRIYNNALVFDGTARTDTFAIRYTGSSLASNDYYVEAVVDKASDNDNALGVIGRKANGTGDANTDGYAFYYYSDTYYLMELTDSGETSLGTYGTTDALAHTLRLVCNGSRISANIDGTERIAVTGETTYASGGVGLAIGAYGSADASTWDSFTASDLSAGGVVGPLLQGKLVGSGILQGRLVR